MSNILSYIPNFIKSNPSLPSIQGAISNRVNNMGDALEIYIRDVIAGTLEDIDKQEKLNNAFSWLGNTNNIPDAILKNSDALEIKKVESINSNLALNSSPPKNKLHKDDTRINKAVISCEDNAWETKNLYYVIGHCPKGKKTISNLLFVDGDCYAADRAIYQSMADRISTSVKEAEGVEFHKTNELANVRKVDPLGITELRVRGMWHIKTPYKLFSDFVKNDPSKFNLGFLAKKDKYDAVEQHIKYEINDLADVRDIKISNPNNPAQNIDAFYISYEV